MTQEKFEQAEAVMALMRRTQRIINTLSMDIPFDAIKFVSSTNAETIACGPAIIAEIRAALLERYNQELQELKVKFIEL